MLTRQFSSTFMFEMNLCLNECGLLKNLQSCLIKFTGIFRNPGCTFESLREKFKCRCLRLPPRNSDLVSVPVLEKPPCDSNVAPSTEYWLTGPTVSSFLHTAVGFQDTFKPPWLQSSPCSTNLTLHILCSTITCKNPFVFPRVLSNLSLTVSC